MAKLDFAFWDPIMGADSGPKASADVFDEHIRLAQRIEELGWHSYFTIEHQNTPQGAQRPAVYLTAVARETSTLRLGAMMWQLPFYNPLRLAQEVAMLDQLSRGRVEFGTGIGVHEHEFIRWGMDYYQRAAISEEVLEDRQDGLDPATRSPSRASTSSSTKRCPHPKPLPAAVSAHLGRRAQRHVGRVRRAQQLPRRQEPGHRRRRGAASSTCTASVWKESGHAGPMPRMFLHARGPRGADGRAGARGGPRVRRGRRRRAASAAGRSPRRASAGAATRAAWARDSERAGQQGPRPDDGRRPRTTTSSTSTTGWRLSAAPRP